MCKSDVQRESIQKYSSFVFLTLDYPLCVGYNAKSHCPGLVISCLICFNCYVLNCWVLLGSFPLVPFKIQLDRNQ